MTPEDEQRKAIASLLDVVQELAVGLSYGQKPDPGWSEVVESSFNEHRQELGLATHD